MNELTPTETARLADLEKTIRSGLTTFYEVAAALEEIRRCPRLYRAEGYTSFEDYCDRRWQMCRQRAYGLIQAAEVRRNLSSTEDILPANEYQARALAPLPPVLQQSVWAAAILAANGQQPTSAHVHNAIDALTDLALEAKVSLGKDGQVRLEEAEQGELRRREAEVREKADSEKRADDITRMAEHARKARVIAERRGWLAITSKLRAAEKAMEGVG